MQFGSNKASNMAKYEQFAPPPGYAPQLKSFIIMPFLDRFHSKFADVHYVG